MTKTHTCFGSIPFNHHLHVLCVVSHVDSLRPQGLNPASLLCAWGFSRQEYWSGLPCPSRRDLPNPGIELRSPEFQVDSLQSEPPGKPILAILTITSIPHSKFPEHPYNLRKPKANLNTSPRDTEGLKGPEPPPISKF